MKQNFVLTDDWAARISRLSISTKSRLRGQHKGSHRSQRFGASLDFSDYREYHPGDDVRQIDWNVFARTEKHFIKRFLDEQEMRVHILLDTSKSMGGEDKWLFARQLAAALGIMVLNKDDRLSFSTVNDQKEPMFRRKGTSYRKAFSQTVSMIESPQLNGSFAERAISFIPKDVTVLIIITDGLETIESWEAFLRRVPRFAKDVRILQIQSEEEISPMYSGDVRMIDVETEERVNVSVSQRVLVDYEIKREKHQAELEAICRKFGILLMPVKSNDGIMHVLFHQLLRANWVH